jgi:uncharacterized membrane protein
VPGESPIRAASAWRDPVVWLVAALALGAYFVISLYRLLTHTPSAVDLGTFTEFEKQVANFHAPVTDLIAPGMNIEGDHFQVAVAVIAPFFRLFPSPATLLLFQALFAAVSVFPVVTAATALTGRSSGRLIGFAYVFSWGLQQMIDFDFHEVALAVPLLAFSLSALVRRRPGAAIAWAAPLVFVKEDQGFTLVAVGALLSASAVFPSLLSAPAEDEVPAGTAVPAGRARPGRARPQWLTRLGVIVRTDDDPRGYATLWGGVALAGWGLFWSVFAITVIIPHFNPQHDYRYWAAYPGAPGGTSSFGALLAHAGTAWPVKLTTVVMMLLATAFIALGSPVALLVIPSLLLRFVSIDPMYWNTGWHYNATAMPILFIAAADAIGRWRRAPDLAPATTEAGRTRLGPAGPVLVRPVLARPVLARLVSGWHGLAHAAKTGAARHGAAMMAAIAVALAFQFPLSALWHGETYTLDAHTAAADAAVAVVPEGATVTTNLDLVAPLAARAETFWIGNSGGRVTQYIVFDGDDSGYAPPVTDVPGFIAANYGKDGYVQVFARDNVYVYRRG